MPLFGTQYDVEKTPESMGFEAHFDSGQVLIITPHLCSAHDHPSKKHDHRGWLDCTLITREPMFGIPVPDTTVIDLELASALIEGLMEVGPWVEMNKEADEETDQEEE